MQAPVARYDFIGGLKYACPVSRLLFWRAGCSIFSWLQGDHPVHQAGRRSKVLVLTRTLSCLNSALRTSFVLGMTLRFPLQCANYSDLS